MTQLMNFWSKLSEEKTLSLHNNGYDLLRLLLAAAVVYTHSYAIGGFGPEPLRQFSKEDVLLGQLGVLGFFGLSGFLVSASFARSRSLWSYAWKRCRRIFPGFWVCLVLTAFFFAPAIWLVGGQTLAEFPWFTPRGAWHYVTSNFLLTIREQSVGNVLASAAWPGSINGSLWSLFPEFTCYIAIAVLGLGGALTGSRWLLGGVAVVAFLYHASNCIDGREAFPHVPTFYAFTTWAPYLTAFAVGACASAWRDSVKFSWATVAVLAVFAALLLRLGGFDIAAPILVTALVLCAGSCFAMRLHTDLSYGIYIYSFPCQQLLFAAGFASAGLPIYCAASLLASAGCAWLSWTFIERPALHRA
jgi:peptidoglycan/LPS O-acetylase OafA/YrhL